MSSSQSQDTKSKQTILFLYSSKITPECEIKKTIWFIITLKILRDKFNKSGTVVNTKITKHDVCSGVRQTHDINVITLIIKKLTD